MAVIIPKEILDEIGAREGDVVKLLVPIPKQKRNAAIKKMAGSDPKSRPFARDEGDRF